MKKTIEEEYKKYFLSGLLIIFLIMGFLLIKNFIIPIFTSIFLAYLFLPIRNILKKKIKKDWLVALILSFMIILIIIIPVVISIKVLTTETLNTYEYAKKYLDSNKNMPFIDMINTKLGLELNIQEVILSGINQVITFGKKFLSSIPKLLMNFFIIIILTYYLIKDWERFIGRITKVIPLNNKQKEELKQEINKVTTGVIYGAILTAIIQGIIATIGFMIFKVESPLFFGFLLMIAALIPVSGTALIWAPISLIMIIKGFMISDTNLIFNGFGLFMYGLLLVSTIDNIIKPRLIGEKTHIHPALILLGAIGGVNLFGFIGIIFGPIIIGMIFITIKMYSEKEA